jgi:endonuclease III
MPAPIDAPRRSTRNLKRPSSDVTTPSNGVAKKLKLEEDSDAPKTPPKSSRASRVKVKAEPASPSPSKKATASASPADKAAALQSRKLASYAFDKKSPFPTFLRPTPEECVLAHRILADLHGDRVRPEVVKAPRDSAGCGNSASVLDALVRTILSQNTSDANSSRAKRAMDDEYGGSDKWEAIAKGGQARLQKAIQSGGLAVVKSRVIIDILTQVHERYGEYSLDHLFDEADDGECMREMLSFRGVGPKTASCVLLFCLKRQSFAVDTHVQRLTGLLGWRPPSASREEAHAHLDARIPPEEKYPLHVLLIAHGKRCEECKAGGKNLGKCKLRKAFRESKVKGEAGQQVKDEELEAIKEESE